MVLIAALWGCDDPCAEGDDIGRSTYSAHTTLTDENGTIAAEIRWPTRDPEGETWPVAVVVPGGFVPDEVATYSVEVGVQNDDGVVSVHVDMAGESWLDGVDDLRGSIARKAIALALRYAAGETNDDNTCSILGRSPAARVDRTVLVGLSNGGNVVAATLADNTLDLPPIAGWVSWETPSGAQFVNQEHENSTALYTPGTCVLTSARLECPYNVTDLTVTQDGALCFDTNADGFCSTGDFEAYGTTNRETGLQMVSPPLAQLAANAGLVADKVADLDAVTAFWDEREAAAMAAAVVSTNPDLPIILLGSEIDHVLTGLSDHPHLFGLGEALQRANARWTRLNPGKDWTSYESENEPNAPLSLADPQGWLTPEEGASLEQNLAAAVREISDRTDGDMW